MLTDAQEAHTESAWVSVTSLWRQRSRVLLGRVSRARLAGIETRLLADLWRLSQTTEPELVNAEHPLLALAVRTLGKTEPGALAAEWLGSGCAELDADWQSLIGLLGVEVWAPVLAELVSHPECPEPLFWQLLGRMPALRSVIEQSPFLHFDTDQPSQPGQIRYALSHGLCQPAECAAEWIDEDNDEVWESDLTALLLALYPIAPEQARARVARGLAHNPSRPFWLHWAAALALPEAAAFMQQGFVEDLVDSWTLALHGHTDHLDFCLELLDQPRTNALGAQLWQALTTETLPRVARLSVVGEAAAELSSEDTLADADTARSQRTHWQDKWPERQRATRDPLALKRHLSLHYGRSTTAWILAFCLVNSSADLSEVQSVWLRLAHLNNGAA